MSAKESPNREAVARIIRDQQHKIWEAFDQGRPYDFNALADAILSLSGEETIPAGEPHWPIGPRTPATKVVDGRRVIAGRSQSNPNGLAPTSEEKMEWLRGDWFEAFQDCETAIGEGGVGQTIIAALRQRLEDKQAPNPIEGGEADLAQRQAVNRILGELIGPYEPDFAKRIEIGNRACSVILAALKPSDGLRDDEPKWGNADTVGNLIAQLRTMDPDAPIFAGYHVRMDDGSMRVKVRGLHISRERVVGTNIVHDDVPLTYVAWAGEPTPAPTLDEIAKAAAPFVRHYEKWMDNRDDDIEMSTFARVTFGQVRALRTALASVPGDGR